MFGATFHANSAMIKTGRFVLAAVAFTAFGLSSINNAVAWDFPKRGNGNTQLQENTPLRENIPLPENVTEAASTPTFSPNQDVTVSFNGVIVAAHPYAMAEVSD